MTEASDLAGKVAIVTGGGASPGRVSSIGEATARLLAGRGARVAVVDIARESAEKTVAAIVAEGGEAIALVADLRREAECETVAADCAAAFGRVDILVNNVGMGSGGAVAELTEEAFDEAIGINLKTAFFMAKHSLARMSAGGAIVNVSTTAIDTPTRSMSYGATKAAVEAMTKHIALQHGPDGIRCNTVRPGEVWTAMVDRNCPNEAAADRLRADRAKRAVLPFDGDAWDVARAIAFLASDEARWITGQTISVDGGAPLIRPNPDWREHHSYWKAGR